MAISIKHEETEKLVRQLADLTGQSITDTVQGAVKHELDNLQRKMGRTELVADLLRMSKRASEHMNLDKYPLHSSDVDSLLYDDKGLPK